MMYRDESVYESALKALVERFGDVERFCEPYDFIFTDYYEEEMGQGLKKGFVVFQKTIDRARLADIKLFTNMLEKELSVDCKRAVNIDPGYVTRANLVLATTKEFSHRIYLKEGIFAEVTLLFKKGGCKCLDWTYPDFRTKKTCDFFYGICKEM